MRFRGAMRTHRAGARRRIRSLGTTLLKGLAVLEALAMSDEPRGITNLAHELGLAKSDVHRLLQTLAHRGYTRKDPDSGRYECTLKVWELGALVAERLDVRRVARPYVEDLARRTTETVHLSVLDGTEVLYVDKIDSPQPVRAYSRVGGRAPAYCVATGKALLAHVPDAVLDRIVTRLKRYSARTITDADGLRKELRKVRDVGYAINRGEYRETVCGLAAPIFNLSGEAIAAIGISGPIERLSATRLRDLAPAVVTAARAISRALGFSGGTAARAA
jgi:IclR family transcriptional regulator, KDG regulon repressor